MSIRFCSLSSGSNGNSHFLETDKSKVLIDAGFSGKRIEELLDSIKVCPSELDGIFVTHEHIDHVKGVGILSRRYDLPIFANRKTWESMINTIGKVKEDNIKIFDSNEYFEYRDLTIKPIDIYHDAVEPVGYLFHKYNKKVTVLTDTGSVDDQIVEEIKDSNLYMIEANHDEFMLKNGNYPWHLKERILGEEGHLSNRATASTLNRVLKGRNEIVLLGHLSQDNNMPELAYETVRKELSEEGLKVGEDINLEVSKRNQRTEIFEI